MSSKTITFQLFRYQLLPMDRHLQGNLVTGVKTVKELIERKNEFFTEALSQIEDFSDRRSKTKTKKLIEKDDFFLMRIANNRSMHRETKEFKDETIDNWPSLLVAIWNDPTKQTIAVQKRTTAFINSETVAKLISKKISEHIAFHRLTMKYEPLFDKKNFWLLVDKHKDNIEYVEFRFITPNMANISANLSHDMEQFSKATNSIQNTFKIEADPGASLRLDKETPSLSGLVDYSSEGGGNIRLKASGVKKAYNTSDSVKEVSIDEIEIEGNQEAAKVLKEILK